MPGDSESPRSEKTVWNVKKKDSRSNDKINIYKKFMWRALRRGFPKSVQQRCGVTRTLDWVAIGLHIPGHGFVFVPGRVIRGLGRSPNPTASTSWAEDPEYGSSSTASASTPPQISSRRTSMPRHYQVCVIGRVGSGQARPNRVKITPVRSD